MLAVSIVAASYEKLRRRHSLTPSNILYYFAATNYAKCGVFINLIHMLAINKINHIGFLLSLLTLFSFSCYPDNKNCPEIKIGKDYTGYGVLLYFDDSQDGMNSLFFFPCCNYSNGEIDSISFWKETFKKGISFRLPRYSSIFKKIKNKAKIFNDDYRGKTHFDYVNIRFSNNKSSMSSYSKDKNYWNLYFSANGQKKTLQYYISDSLQISELNSL